MQILRIILWGCVLSISLTVLIWERFLIHSTNEIDRQSYRDEERLDCVFIQRMVNKFNPDMLWRNELKQRGRNRSLFTKDFQETLLSSPNKIIGIVGDIEDIEKSGEGFLIYIYSPRFEDRLRFLLTVDKHQLQSIEQLALQKKRGDDYALIVSVDSVEPKMENIFSCEGENVECEFRNAVLVRGQILDIHLVSSGSSKCKDILSYNRRSRR